MAHDGRNATLQHLHVRGKGIWIIRPHCVLDSLIHKCVVCLRLNQSSGKQLMADLPKDRVQPSPPFTGVGCDTFGPFHIKEKRTEVKRYGIVFTCLSSRAVPLEVVSDLSADSFICAFRRIQAIRGPVTKVRCDQGTNFVGAKKELKTQGYTKSCDFEFNAPYASHIGGEWEHQIRSARRTRRMGQ